MLPVPAHMPAVCPPEYPYLCSRLQVCYQDAESARTCTGPPNTWCGLPGLTVPDQISKEGWGRWCSNGKASAWKRGMEVQGGVIVGTGVQFMWLCVEFGHDRMPCLKQLKCVINQIIQAAFAWAEGWQCLLTHDRLCRAHTFEGCTPATLQPLEHYSCIP